MIRSFLRYIEFEKRYSKHTLTSYQNDLEQFEKFLQKEFEQKPEEANHAMIRSWIVSLIDQEIQPRSVNRKITSLKSFYKFLLKREHIEKDPTWKLHVLKTPKQLPHFVQEGDFNRMLDQAPLPEEFPELRDRIVVELFYATGMRRAELIHLKSEDINKHSLSLKVLGKRNKERIIPFAKSLLEIIDQYQLKKEALFGINTDSFIVNDKGRPCSEMMIYKTVKDFLATTSVDKKSPHVLRHSFATHLLDRGADLNAVKDLLGHTSLAATQVYTHNTLDKLKKVFDQAHPKA